MEKYLKSCIASVELIIIIWLFGLLHIYDKQIDNMMKTSRETKEIVKSMTDRNTTLTDNYISLENENEELKAKLLEVEIPTYEFTDAEIYLLAQCVEAEAGYDDLSQKYVTQVILNRLHSGKFPNTIVDVIYQRVNGVPQFSVAWNGAMEREVQPQTLANVYSVLVHGTDLPEYVCYFYSTSVTQNWVNSLNIHTTVSNTVFAYSSKEDY